MEQKRADMAHSEEAYLDAVRENEPATTQQVADAVGVTRQGADYRLRELREEGLVDGEMLGNTLIWTVTDKTTE
ncbi:helix-turn-helix domain-containing protein [Halorubrum sp. Atlit-26R]|uniref:winged helix-turn-helix domain-containing protein n=1 Tax=Halorubrum sp. Atlit-26R TaxID=2282128 RepID=UPI000EF1BE67|nr:helix-turn-helix domain-containing protein [Halorubrum sp. Atlit-26R]RLM62558.1 ArsR family transcriptional regulator [Halorubrum sp. Atlit-26R]